MISVKPFMTSFLVAALLTASPVHAALLTGTITGVVTSAGSLVPDIGVGTPLTGSYTYDTSAPFMGVLGTTDPLTAFSLSIGTHVFTLGDLSNSAGVVLETSNAVANELYFHFRFSALVALSGDGNILSQGISIAPPQRFSIENADPARSLSFDFLASPQIAAAAIPESQSGSLLMIGGIAFGLMRWRARRMGRPGPPRSTSSRPGGW